MRFKGEAQEEAKCNMLEYLGLLEGALNELSYCALNLINDGNLQIVEIISRSTLHSHSMQVGMLYKCLDTYLRCL